MNSFDISLAYPPTVEPSSFMSTSRNSAPMDSTSSNEHLGRGHLASCCDLSGEEPAKVVRGLHHCSVPADVAHRGKSIKHLSSGDPRDTVHAKSSQILGGKSLDQIRVLSGIEEGVEDGLVSQEGNLLDTRLSQLQGDVLVEGGLLPHNVCTSSSEI